MRSSKALQFTAALLVVGGIIALLEYSRPKRIVPTNADIPVSVSGNGGQGEGTGDRQAVIQSKINRYPRAKEIQNPHGYLNTESISLAEHIGKKVILIDFWTYSCINCQRTIPYLNAWQEKYKDKGLVIIGVHTPEFEFEKKIENVRLAVERFGITYPVLLDNDYATWSAYKNQYWPRKYLIDIDGFVVYDHIGEGAYAQTEAKIQELLEERMALAGEEGVIEKTIARPADAPRPDFRQIRSPETYFGSARNRNLGNGEKLTSGIQTLVEPRAPDINTLYLAGEWRIDPEFAQNQSGQAKIIFRYEAKAVYLVGGAEKETRLAITRDNKPLGSAAGSDVREENGVSVVYVREERLYRITEDPGGYGEHVLEITIEEPGVRAFAFTFG